MNGNISTYTNENGDSFNFIYDADGKLLSETDPLGSSISREYDSMGRVTKRTDKNGEFTNYEYNSRGLLVKETDQLGTSLIYAYDNGANLVSKTDKLSNVTSYSYNLRSELTEIRKPDGSVKSFIYDGEGNIISESFGKLSVKSILDANSNPTALEYSDGTVLKQISFEYDLLGNVVKSINAENQEVVYTYDNNQRIIQVVSENGNAYKYDYDLNGMSKADSSYIYSNSGNLLEEISPKGIKTFVYNDDNKLVKGTNEKGETSEYTYNGLGSRVATNKVKENPNKRFTSYGNSDASDLISGINEIYESAPDISQNTYETELGLIKSKESATVKKEYVVDYSTLVKNDIMVYEEGSHVSSYVYGLDRISAKNTKVTDYNNIAADIAVDDIEKVYYVQDYIGNSIYTQTKEADILTFAHYDEWGEPDTRESSSHGDDTSSTENISVDISLGQTRT